MLRPSAAFILLFPILVIGAAFAQSPGVLYDNGRSCPGYCHSGWQINDGHVVTDSFYASTNVSVSGFDFWVWEFPGDKALRVRWTISSDPFGGTIYGSGSTLVSETFNGTNEYGYDIDRITVSGLHLSLPSGTYWLTLQDLVDQQHIPVYWDENSGELCHSPGCPSLASENQVGTIPSETFDIRGVRQPTEDDETRTPGPLGSILWSSPLLIGLGFGVCRIVP